MLRQNRRVVIVGLEDIRRINGVIRKNNKDTREKKASGIPYGVNSAGLYSLM